LPCRKTKDEGKEVEKGRRKKENMRGREKYGKRMKGRRKTERKGEKLMRNTLNRLGCNLP
jgi:hypothetical protein